MGQVLKAALEGDLGDALFAVHQQVGRTVEPLIQKPPTRGRAIKPGEIALEFGKASVAKPGVFLQS